MVSGHWWSRRKSPTLTIWTTSWSSPRAACRCEPCHRPRVGEPAIVHHSIRSFLFARCWPTKRDLAMTRTIDEDLLFAATVMHDWDSVSSPQVRLASRSRARSGAAVLREHGVQTPHRPGLGGDRPHSSVGIAHRRGLLTYLTHRGVFIDVGLDTDAPLTDWTRDTRRLPKAGPGSAPSWTPSSPSTRSEAAAPPGSLAFELCVNTRGGASAPLNTHADARSRRASRFLASSRCLSCSASSDRCAAPRIRQ